MSDLKERFLSSSAETGLFDVQLSAMAAESFLSEISVLLLLIPWSHKSLFRAPKSFSATAGINCKDAPGKEKKVSGRNKSPVGRHFSLDIKKNNNKNREKWIFLYVVLIC